VARRDQGVAASRKLTPGRVLRIDPADHDGVLTVEDWAGIRRWLWLSQEEAAHAVGVSLSMFQRW
jgi:DNA-binding transcriptional regulator YiaG